MTIQQQVAEFHKKYKCLQGFNLLEYNGQTGRSALVQRFALIAEEFDEVADAFRSLDTAVYQKRGDNTIKERSAKLLKELCDLVYVITGTSEAFGWDQDEAFNRVHESNMTKDGGVNENSGVTKGDGYRPPELNDLV